MWQKSEGWELRVQGTGARRGFGDAQAVAAAAPQSWGTGRQRPFGNGPQRAGGVRRQAREGWGVTGTVGRLSCGARDPKGVGHS